MNKVTMTVKAKTNTVRLKCAGDYCEWYRQQKEKTWAVGEIFKAFLRGETTKQFIYKEGFENCLNDLKSSVDEVIYV